MPKVLLSREERIADRIRRYLKSELRYTKAGELLGVSRQSATRKIDEMTIRATDLIVIFQHLGTPPVQIGELFTEK